MTITTKIADSFNALAEQAVNALEVYDDSRAARAVRLLEERARLLARNCIGIGRAFADPSGQFVTGMKAAMESGAPIGRLLREIAAFKPSLKQDQIYDLVATAIEKDRSDALQVLGCFEGFRAALNVPALTGNRKMTLMQFAAEGASAETIRTLEEIIRYWNALDIKSGRTASGAESSEPAPVG